MRKSKKEISWKALSVRGRGEDLEDLKASISDCGGFITHFSMFSDLGLGLNLEIEEKDILRLYVRLQSFLSIAEDAPEGLKADSEEEWQIRMHVSFSKGSGDLKVEVPMVPG